MRKKLKDSGGFSLVEMLCAVAILVLLCLMMSTGLGMAVKSYQDVVAETETELLLSSLADALTDKLRYCVVTAKIVGTDPDKAYEMTSASIGVSKDAAGNVSGLDIAVVDGKVTVDMTTVKDAEGNPVKDGEGNPVKVRKQLLPDGAYGKGRYKVTEAAVTCNCGAPKEGKPVFPVFTVKLKVEETSGGIGAETTLTVRCLNPVKEEGTP